MTSKHGLNSPLCVSKLFFSTQNYPESILVLFLYSYIMRKLSFCCFCGTCQSQNTLSVLWGSSGFISGSPHHFFLVFYSLNPLILASIVRPHHKFSVLNSSPDQQVSKLKKYHSVLQRNVNLRPGYL